MDKDKRNIETLKQIVRGLHEGADVPGLREWFAQLLKEVEPVGVSRMVEELVDEGLRLDEVQRLCDLHADVVRSSLDEGGADETLPGHPVHTFMAENVALAAAVDEFDSLVERLTSDCSSENLKSLKDALRAALAKLFEVEKHYLRKENQLFPFLEKHGITGPSRMMWSFHDNIRDMLKEIKRGFDEEKAERIIEAGAKAVRAITDMIFKENNLLFPMALQRLGEEEWLEIRRGEEEVGYAFSVTPGDEWPFGGVLEERPDSLSAQEGGLLPVDTGELTLEQVNLILTHLPVDITFVDENDEVRYYSDSKERIFPRSPGIIGRKVQNCHPPKSLHVVNRIVEEFKAGTRDAAEFWLPLDGKFVYIRYFPVRDEEGNYRGTIEVTQNIAAIKELAGERRLLDWKWPAQGDRGRLSEEVEL